MDDNGHGTHVSGIITANGGSAKGVAPDTKIIALKVLDASGSGSFSSIIAAIYNATDTFKVDVISMSLGTSSPYIYTSENCDAAFVELANAINYANSKGVAVVAASGNYNLYGQSGVSIPGCMSGAIGVGAVDGSDGIPWWSGEGISLDIAAPGVNIYSTLPDNTYASYSGTSMATPHVSGVIALMKQARRSLSVDETRNVLFTSAKDFGSSGFDRYYGWGRVNASAAVEYAGNFDTIGKMHIQSITITSQKDKTRGTRAAAVITVVDETGSPAQGASVSVRWSGVTSDADWASTGSDGKATVYSDWKRNARGTFTATVTNVIKPGLLYNASAGMVTGSTK